MPGENIEKKTKLVEKMRGDVERAATVLFLDYTGLTVAEADGLRRKLRDAQVGYLVVKNSLMARALEGTPYEAASACLKGTPTGVVFGYDDPVSAAKLTFDYLKSCEHLKIKGGVLDKKAITATEAETLSKMPSKAEVQASVIALALGPARKLLGQIKNPAGRIVGAIDKLAKEEQAE